MTINRDELAAQFLASLLTKDDGAPQQLADFAVECADALLAALRSTAGDVSTQERHLPCPNCKHDFDKHNPNDATCDLKGCSCEGYVMPTADTPEPRRTVGAVVGSESGENNDPEDLLIVVTTDPNACQRFLDNTTLDSGLAEAYDDDKFVRWATRAECETHGIKYIERTVIHAKTLKFDPLKSL